MLPIHASPAQICYFSIQPPAQSHFTSETPLHSPTLSPIESPADPTHPLLAFRDIDTLAIPPATPLSPTPILTILQMQTAAAHEPAPTRPRPYPVQDVLQVSSDDSRSSTGSTSSTESTKSSLDLARCSRCQRTPSVDIRSGKSNMVQYGLNLWYCNRCANMVGLLNR